MSIKRSAICVVVNKPQPALDPSETFIRAHVVRLAEPVVSLVGDPCQRFTGLGRGRPLLSQAESARAMRWLARRFSSATIARQDTRSLMRYFRRMNVGVVLAEYGVTALSVAQACRELSVPLVTHFHGWDAYVLASDPDARADYQRLFEQSVAIIAVSQHMRDHLLSLGAPSTKLVVNRCGAQVDVAMVADPGANGPRFLSIGRSAPKKATVVTLLAFAQLHEKFPNARLDLVGVHVDWNTGQLIRALKLNDAVTLHGPLPHASVLQLMQQMRCYVHPSVTAPDGDMEGTPVAVLEAMALGVPVVATRHGGIIDVLKSSAAGLLVDEFDVEATTAAMQIYASDAARASADGARGRQSVQERWSMAISLRRLGEIVECARRSDAEGISRLARANAEP